MRERLHGAGLGVDDDRGLRALARHHARLERDGRRPDRALAARDVVAPRVDEEEPEAGAGCDRLGHHRDQETPVPAGLEAQTGPEVVETLLEPATLFTDGAPGQPPEAARQEPHPDPRRMEVDRPEHAIGSHSHLRVQAMRLRSAPSCQECPFPSTPQFRYTRAAGRRAPPENFQLWKEWFNANIVAK